MLKKLQRIIFLLILLGIIAGCSATENQAPTPSLAPATLTPTIPPTFTSTLLPPTVILPSPTATSTMTSVPPTWTSTPTVLPSETPSPTSSPTPSATLRPAARLPGRGGDVKVYLIALKTGGPIGCGDSVVPVSVGLYRSKDTAADIKAALNMLFSMKSKYYGSLYNPVSYSTFRVADINLSEASGFLTVWLSGKYKPSGNKCDNTRVKAQIWSTAKQFGGITGTNFYINGPNPFGDFVSNDG